MEKHKHTAPRAVRIVTVDLVVAVLIFALGALVLYESMRLGSSWGDDGPQAGYFPFYVALLICLSSLAVAVQSLLVLRRDRRTFVEREQLKKVMVILLPSTAFVLGVQFLGIYLSSTVFICLFMRLVGKYTWLRGALVGAGVSVTAFAMFEIWFTIPLPKGPLETLLGY